MCIVYRYVCVNMYIHGPAYPGPLPRHGGGLVPYTLCGVGGGGGARSTYMYVSWVGGRYKYYPIKW